MNSQAQLELVSAPLELEFAPVFRLEFELAPVASLELAPVFLLEPEVAPLFCLGVELETVELLPPVPG